MSFHPMCLYSKYSVFEDNPIMDENQIGPNMNTRLYLRPNVWTELMFAEFAKSTYPSRTLGM